MFVCMKFHNTHSHHVSMLSRMGHRSIDCVRLGFGGGSRFHCDLSHMLSCTSPVGMFCRMSAWCQTVKQRVSDELSGVG